MGRQWEAIRAVPDAVRPGDIIRIRDGDQQQTFKQFKVYLVAHNSYVGYKRRGQRWNKTRDRVYFQNVLAPVLVEPAEPAEPEQFERLTAICPRDGGTMHEGSSFRPPINYKGWVCVGCGHMQPFDAPAVLEGSNGVE